MLYHYTDRDSAADILKTGILRAQPVLVRDALIGGKEIALAPAAWFTVKDSPCPTVLAKMAMHGWPIDRAGMVWRFAVANEAATLDLPAWAHPHGYAPDLFRFMLLTAQVAGEDWRDWRLSNDGVPREQWLTVESLQADGWRKEA